MNEELAKTVISYLDCRRDELELLALQKGCCLDSLIKLVIQKGIETVENNDPDPAHHLRSQFKPPLKEGRNDG